MQYQCTIILSWIYLFEKFYQRPAPNRDFDFPISSQFYNIQEYIKDHQRPNINPAIAHSDSDSNSKKTIRSIFKQSTRMIDYNGDFDSNFDNNMEFVNINLSCNKLSV